MGSRNPNPVGVFFFELVKMLIVFFFDVVQCVHFFDDVNLCGLLVSESEDASCMIDTTIK